METPLLRDWKVAFTDWLQRLHFEMSRVSNIEQWSCCKEKHLRMLFKVQINLSPSIIILADDDDDDVEVKGRNHGTLSLSTQVTSLHCP